MFYSVLPVFLRLSILAAICMPLLASVADADIKIAKSGNTEPATGGASAKAIFPVAPLSEYGITSVALESQNQRLREDAAIHNTERATLEKRVAGLQKELNILKEKTIEANQPPVSAEEKIAYAAGLSMFSGIRGRLERWEAVDVRIDGHWFEAGLFDGLKDTRRVDSNTFDEAWKGFTGRIQSGVQNKMKVSEAVLNKQIGGRTPALTKNGITYLVVSKGQPVTNKNAPVRLSMREQVLDGGVISEVPSLTISAEDSMPTVVRNVLPLLGVGSDIVAYGLAKSVYGSLPLPEHVQPFTVLEYHFKGLTAS
ncbi:MAG: hypothetical protein RSG77_05395 [Hafnia sp.]|uniref:hypothetical protein n=1 Tax=Hafnia sp. TaxID=1873498 RepID=UPI002FC6E3C7